MKESCYVGVSKVEKKQINTDLEAERKSELFGEREILPDIENIIKEKSFILDVLEVVKKYDEVTFKHLIKTGEFAVFAAEELALPKEEKELLLSSALVHDVGKIFIDKETLQSAAKHSYENGYAKIMQRHARESFEYLVGIGAYPEAEVSVRHHEFSKGYPRCQQDDANSVFILREPSRKWKLDRRTKNPQFERLGRILSVLDIFEAMGDRDRPNNRKGELLRFREKELAVFDSETELKLIKLLYEKEARENENIGKEPKKAKVIHLADERERRKGFASITKA